MVYSNLPFDDHVKKFGSNFNQGYSFLSKSNLNVYLGPTQCIDCSLMRVLMRHGHKDFTFITGNTV